MASSPLTVAVFVAATALSLSASVVLVARLERVGARLGLSEALLGLLAALAADTPEITSAVTALTHGQHDVSTGVVLGSNVFNLAALLGLGAVVAGRIRLHRRVVIFEGSLALWMAVLSIAAALGLIAPAAALVPRAGRPGALCVRVGAATIQPRDHPAVGPAAVLARRGDRRGRTGTIRGNPSRKRQPAGCRHRRPRPRRRARGKLRHGTQRLGARRPLRRPGRDHRRDRAGRGDEPAQRRCRCLPRPPGTRRRDPATGGCGPTLSCASPRTWPRTAGKGWPATAAPLPPGPVPGLQDLPGPPEDVGRGPR